MGVLVEGLVQSKGDEDGVNSSTSSESHDVQCLLM